MTWEIWRNFHQSQLFSLFIICHSCANAKIKPTCDILIRCVSAYVKISMPTKHDSALISLRSNQNEKVSTVKKSALTSSWPEKLCVLVGKTQRIIFSDVIQRNFSRIFSSYFCKLCGKKFLFFECCFTFARGFELWISIYRKNVLHEAW